MRLTDTQIQAICQVSRQVAGERSRVRVFGSRLDDAAHGEDLDLMLELTESVDNSALMAAQLSGLVSRAMNGRNHLRNQMVHEYIEDPVVLTSALQTSHAFVPALITAANKMITEIERRG